MPYAENVRRGVSKEIDDLYNVDFGILANVSTIMTETDNETREKFLNLPMKYSAIFRKPTNRSLASTTEAKVKLLVDAANFVHEAKPDFIPHTMRTYSREMQETVSGKAMQGYSDDAIHTLAAYTNLKYGQEKSRRFWLTLSSDTSNYPKPSDFLKHEKLFDSE